jgi:hypothetical protein
MFGSLPACGLWVRHAAGLNIRDLTLHAPPDETRPGLVVDDAHEVTLSGLHGSKTSAWWNNVQASAFDAGPVRVSGSQTKDLTVYRQHGEAGAMVGSEVPSGTVSFWRSR